MNTRAPFATASIGSVTWEDAGSDDDPKSRLLAQIAILGCPMHLEAVAVVERPLPFNEDRTEQDAADPEFSEMIADLYRITSADDGWLAVAIDDREYVLFASPHCQ
jgi:hypothetical protein